LKLLVTLLFLICGIVFVCGGGPTGSRYDSYIGGRYWQEPGAFANGLKGVCRVFVTAAFSFAGTELVGLAASETPNPRKTMPSAVKQTFWRYVEDARISYHSDPLKLSYQDHLDLYFVLDVDRVTYSVRRRAFTGRQVSVILADDMSYVY
jgi:hypothetical protein